MFRSTLKLSLMMLVAGAIAVQALSWSAGRLFHDTLTQGQREGRKGYVFLLRSISIAFPARLAPRPSSASTTTRQSCSTWLSPIRSPI